MNTNLPKKTSPFEIIKHINEKDGLDFDISHYLPFMINRGLSFTKDTIFFANVMNRYSALDKDVQYAFLYNGIPKGKRFGKWIKKTESDDIVSLVASYFCINNSMAEKYLPLLSNDELEFIKNKTMRGGKK